MGKKSPKLVTLTGPESEKSLFHHTQTVFLGELFFGKKCSYIWQFCWKKWVILVSAANKVSILVKKIRLKIFENVEM